MKPADGTEGKLIITEHNLLPRIPESPTGQGNQDSENVEPGKETRSSGLDMKTQGPEMMSNSPRIPQQVGGQVTLSLQQPERQIKYKMPRTERRVNDDKENVQVRLSICFFHKEASVFMD